MFATSVSSLSQYLRVRIRYVQVYPGVFRYAPGMLQVNSGINAHPTQHTWRCVSNNTTPSWLQRNVKRAKFIKVKIEVNLPSGKLTVRMSPGSDSQSRKCTVVGLQRKISAARLPLLGQVCFPFHAVYKKIWPNNRLVPLLGFFPPPWEILDSLLAHTANLNFTKNIKFREREQGVMKTPSPPASWKNCHWLG